MSTPTPLTQERLAEARASLNEDMSQWGGEYGGDLLAEVDRLRAQLTGAREDPPARPAPWATHPARLQQWDTWEDVPVCTHVHGAHGAVQYCKAADGTVSIKGVFIPEWREMPRTPERMDELAPFTPATGTAPHAAPRTHAKAGQR